MLSNSQNQFDPNSSSCVPNWSQALHCTYSGPHSPTPQDSPQESKPPLEESSIFVQKNLHICSQFICSLFSHFIEIIYRSFSTMLSNGISMYVTIMILTCSIFVKLIIALLKSHCLEYFVSTFRWTLWKLPMMPCWYHSCSHYSCKLHLNYSDNPRSMI